MTVIIFLCRKQAAKLTREQPKLTFAFVAHILFFDSLGQLKGDTWAPWFWLTLLPIQSTKQTDHFIPKEFRSVSFLSQFLSHAKKKKKKRIQTLLSAQTPSECFELTGDKHSRLQTSLGKVRKYVIYTKGSAEGKNRSRMREMDGILLLMTEQRG